MKNIPFCRSDSIDRRPLEPETITKFIEALPASLTLDDGATISGSMLRAHYQLWSRTGSAATRSVPCSMGISSSSTR
jgi:hypothetical protein